MRSCQVCHLSKKTSDFEPKIIKEHIKHKTALVCKACEDLGYTVVDLRSYVCTGRGGHTCGHKKFDKRVIDHYNQGQNNFCARNVRSVQSVEKQHCFARAATIN